MIERQTIDRSRQECKQEKQFRELQVIYKRKKMNFFERKNLLMEKQLSYAGIWGIRLLK